MLNLRHYITVICMYISYYPESRKYIHATKRTTSKREWIMFYARFNSHINKCPVHVPGSLHCETCSKEPEERSALRQSTVHHDSKEPCHFGWLKVHYTPDSWWIFHPRSYKSAISKGPHRITKFKPWQQHKWDLCLSSFGCSGFQCRPDASGLLES